MRWHGMSMLAASGVMLLGIMAAPPLGVAQGDAVLKAADVQKLLPDAVWYKGQSAPSQKRNSGGVKFADGSYVLATLVDNSGYASDVAAKYQAKARKAANRTTPTPPTAIAQARSLRACRRSSLDTANFVPTSTKPLIALFSQKRRGSSRAGGPVACLRTVCWPRDETTAGQRSRGKGF